MTLPDLDADALTLPLAPAATPDRPTPWTARAGVLLAALLAAASAGCGQRACIEWSQFEGTCPSAAVAPSLIGTCTNITSVDGEGTHEGELCCYPVTKVGPLPDCFTEPTTTGRPTQSTSGPGNNFCDGQGQCGDLRNFGCSACAATDLCKDESTACAQNGGCSNILTCQASCFENDVQCLKQCEAPNPDGLALFKALTRCTYCVECSSDCSSHASECSSAPSGATGAGGAGGMSGTGGAGGKGGAGGSQ